MEKEIEFNNSQKPNSRFDIVKMEHILKKQHSDHSSYQFHILKFYAIIVITDGEDVHYIDFKKYDCKKGTILLIQKDQVHKFSKDSTLKGFILIFHDDFLVRLLNEQQAIKALQLFNHLLFPTALHLNPIAFKEVIDNLDKINIEYFNTKETFSNQILCAHLYLIITSLNRENEQNYNIKTGNKYLSTFLKLQELMHNQILNTSKVKDYAEQLFISTKTLNTVVKSTVGKQAKEYLNDFLLLSVKRKLMEKELSIKECAYQSGFNDVPNFYKFLKQHLKVTPEEFRKKY